MSTKRKIILSIIGVIIFIYLAIYTVLTPFIRGVVVDEITKRPVENAWVMATATIATRTIAGDVGGTYLISRPHLRTGKDGVFYIFPKLYPSIPTPFTFGNMKKRLIIAVRVMDGKRAEVNLSEGWWRRFFFEFIPVKFVVRKEDDIYMELATLTGYCTAGGFGLLQMNRSEKCDSWELEYTITQYEKLLTELNQPNNVRQKIMYSGALRVLSNLYLKKEKYEKALQLLKTARDFDLIQRLDTTSRDYDVRIMELEKKVARQ